MTTETSIARQLAPEDIAAGTYIAVLGETVEIPAAFFCRGEAFDLTSASEMVRFEQRPMNAGMPLRVLSICLPFVLTEDVRGRARTLDVRECRLTLLDERYALLVRSRLQRERAEKRARKERKRERDKSSSDE